MEKKKFPIAYIIAIVVGLVMVGLTIWQFTLPETNPLAVMGILSGGGALACFIVASHRINHSYTPFHAASLPLGVMLIWGAVVFLACGIWWAILVHSALNGIIATLLAVFLGVLGYGTLKD